MASGTSIGARRVLGQFGNLMTRSGDVINGFPDRVAPEDLQGNFRYDPATLEENLIFGSPAQVIDKLAMYDALGVDGFIYYASMGMDMDQQKRSLGLFIDQVMPAFDGGARSSGSEALAHAG